MNTNLSTSTALPGLDAQIQKRLSEDSPLVQDIILENHPQSPKTCEKVIERASKLIQDINLSRTAFDPEPSMVERVRKLTPEGILRVAETLCAIAGKLGVTHNILLEKLPQGILSMPSSHERRIKDEALISHSEALINSLNKLTICLQDLQAGIESEIELLSAKEPFSNFSDPLMKYQDFYWTTVADIERISKETECLLKELVERSKMDVKGSKERELPSKNLLDVFSLCYGLKSMETLNAINAFYKRGDEISDFVFKLKKVKIMMDMANSAFRNKYNLLAFLCTKEIYPDEKVNVSGVEKTALEAYNQDSKNYLVNPLEFSKPVK